MPSEAEVYTQHAHQYERLVRCEDYAGNILPALKRLAPLDGLEVIELGAGTARLTRLLAPQVKRILALDSSLHMLSAGARSLIADGFTNWQAALADHRSLPAADQSADLVIAGWSLCYLAVWGGAEWQSGLEKAFAEMRRVLRPGGQVILLESLGTGETAPHPPVHLEQYLTYLDSAGFHSTWIRTDYRFASLQEAEELSRFFFGDDLAQQIIEHGWQNLPECTGIWWQGVN